MPRSGDLRRRHLPAVLADLRAGPCLAGDQDRPGRHDEAGSGGVASCSSTTRGLLVSAQLALSLMLLVGAGLMGRAFISMRSVPLGFDPARAVTMNVHLQVQRFNGSGTTTREVKLKRLAFYHQLADSTRQIPASSRPASGFRAVERRSDLAGYSAGPDQRESRGRRDRAGRLLESLRVPLVAGRYFTVDDDNRPVVIVDPQLADAAGRGSRRLAGDLLLGAPSVRRPGSTSSASSRTCRWRGSGAAGCPRSS